MGLAEAPAGAPAPATRLRRFVGVGDGSPQRRRLSLRRYVVLTGAALALTGIQLLLLPRWLPPREFGLVVIALSVTQGVLQFGDLGLARMCIDASRPPDDRRRLRAQGHGLTLLSTAVVIVAAAAVAIAFPPYRQMGIVVALGALAGALVASDKYGAAAQEVAGDEVAAGGLNFLWTNVPKMGLLLGLIVFRSAPGVVASSAIAGLVLWSPTRNILRHGVAGLRSARLWVHPSLAIVGSFVLMWADTYFLSAQMGVAAAGAYEALYRLLGVCTYVFLPLISVLTSRVSVKERQPVLRPILLAEGATILTLAGSLAFVHTAAPTFFPNLSLPTEAVPGLLGYYMLLPASYCLGSALYVRAQPAAVTYAVALAAVICLAGHLFFTLGGGPAAAANVAAASMGLAVAFEAVAYERVLRRDRSILPSG